MPVLANNISESIRPLRRYVLWAWAWNGRKWDKPPRQPDGRHASTTNAETWVTLAVALDALRTGRFDGIGFVLGKDEATGLQFAGADFDDCVEGDEVDEQAAYFLRVLHTYSEFSPSRTGVKALCTGTLGPGKKADTGRGIELYDHGRYFCLTGHRLPGTPGSIEERTDALRRVQEEAFGEVSRSALRVRADVSDADLARSALAGLKAYRADDYNEWIAVGMALHSVGDDLLDDWDAWSRHSGKYADGLCPRKWKSFKSGGGIGLGSLIHRAKADGWQPPSAKRADNETVADFPERRFSASFRPERDDGGGVNGTDAAPAVPPIRLAANGHPAAFRNDHGDVPRTGAQVILGYFRHRYDPLFRRDNAVCCRDGREVAMNEACSVADSTLISALARACAAPQYKGGGVNRNALPGFFKTWARVAWGDLLNELRDEDDAELGDDAPAREEFRRLVREALLAECTFGDSISKKKFGIVRQERRSLIGWCAKFAKPGPWRSVRSKRCWYKLRELPGGEEELQVAVRHELFSQLPTADRRLRDMGSNRFSRRADRYGVGQSTRGDRPHGLSAIVLEPEFVRELTATLPDDDEPGEGGMERDMHARA